MKSLAEQYNLPKRTQLIQLNIDTIAIVKKRKSRIIMKDGKQILEMVKHIRQIDKKLKLVLIISGPICSKTMKLLHDNHVDIMVEND